MNNRIKDKRLVISIGILFCFTLFFPSLNAQLFEDFNEPIINNFGDSFATHTVFAEECSFTTCPYCPTVVQIMHNIYTSGQFDFYYVTLVQDMNGYAAARCAELGITGYPTVVYDGDYTRLVGSGASQNDHETAITTCGARTVAPIDLDITAYWLGNGEIQVHADVTNNGGTQYIGHLHVYVTEINSRWSVLGTQYHFAMINNYAINQNINIDPGATEHITATWSGYTDISFSNIKVIGSVFDQSTDYTDETAAADPEYPNTDPPSTPSTPSGPSSGYVGIKYTYSTSSYEPNGDQIKYGWDWDGDNEVDEWTNYYNSGQTASKEHSWSSVGTYNVKVKAMDEFGAESGFSPATSVQITLGDPPNTPSAPTGETNGAHKTSYSYSSSSTDPNTGDKLYYKFNWGDGEESSWKGPFFSGDQVTESHSWDAPGTFNVKVKAKDLAGSESDWSPSTSVKMTNSPPYKPTTPRGPTEGIVGQNYGYYVSTGDPEGDPLEYFFDWGDGTTTGWQSSNTANHKWLEPGEFQVKAKARDWDESSWSPTLTVTIEGGSLTVEAGGPYSGIIGEEIQFNGIVQGGVGPYSWLWDFGDGNSSVEQNPTHIYQNDGEYSLSLVVNDDEGAYGSDIATATIDASHPPNKPTINGSSSVKPGNNNNYTFSAIDPDGDDVFLWIEWHLGDNGSQWEGQFNSGEEVIFNHTWEEKGDYTIRAKSKDINGYESEWETFEVNVRKGKSKPMIWFWDWIIELFPILKIFF